MLLFLKGANMKPIIKERIERTFKKIEDNPSLMETPFLILEEFRDKKYLSPKYLEMWDEVLKMPISQIKELMLSDTEQGEILRSTSVFIKI